MKHGVLKNVHPMLGCDWHIPWVPGTPAPAPAAVPYFVMSVMGGTMVTSKMTSTTFTDFFGLTMLSGTDIGPLLPHMGPPSLTLPFELIGSSSKSHFCVANVQADNSPIVVSLLFVVNPNLNCGMPIPTPTGVVLALTTHRVDMSWADITAGLATMCADFLLQAALAWAGGAIGNRIAGALRGPVMRSVFQSTLFRGLMGEASEVAARRAAMIAAAEANRSMERIVGFGVGFFLGGPMGFDAGALGVPTPGGALSNKATTGQADGEGSGGITGSGRACGAYLDDAGVPGL